MSDPSFWLCLAGGSAVGGALAGLVLWLRARRERARMEIEMRVLRHRKEGMEHGFDLGLRVGASHMSMATGWPLHGFARRCPDCEAINACFQHPSKEYWKCRMCGKRHPSPLAPEPGEVLRMP